MPSLTILLAAMSCTPGSPKSNCVCQWFSYYVPHHINFQTQNSHIALTFISLQLWFSLPFLFALTAVSMSLYHATAHQNESTACPLCTRANSKISFKLLPDHAHNLSSTQVHSPIGAALHQLPSGLESPSAIRPPPDPRRLDVPAPSTLHTFSAPPKTGLPGMRSPPPPPSRTPCTPLVLPSPEPATMPLHHPPPPNPVGTQDVTSVIRILLPCINMCVAMVAMHMTSTDASNAQHAQKKN